MIAVFVTWPYGIMSESKKRVLIFGFKQLPDGSLFPIVADMKTGQISVVNLKDVVVDAGALRKLPLS